MKTIKSLKDITTLEVGDVIVFGNLEYIVCQGAQHQCYFLDINSFSDTKDKIFKSLNLNKRDFIEQLGIDAPHGDFPETKSLEALTAIVSALFKEYEKQNKLPKTWEEFCERNPVTSDEYWIETIESIYCNGFRDRKRDINKDKNVCVSLQEAKAFTALMQLRQLRKAYVKDWKPNYKSRYFGIYSTNGDVSIMEYTFVGRSLSFPTYELAKQFLTNFKNLLEIAKPLL